ncbi:hypothetical protein PGB90_002643 [Kerria lacca]
MQTDKYYVTILKRKKRPLLLSFFVLFLLFLDVTSCVKWLGTYRERKISWNNTKTCKKIRENYGLTGEQTKLCKKITDCMPYVYEAAELVITTCQNLFRHRLWNCSSIKLLPHLSQDLSAGTKERAFVHALSAAALTYTIAKGCASSSIYSCSCSPHPAEPPNGNFKWGGCGDNISWGSKFTRQFVDVKKKPIDKLKKYNKTYTYYDYTEQKNDEKIEDDNDIIEYNKGFNQQIKNYNNEIGRKVVSDSLITHCKCHGVSGSCSIKTCWKGLPLKFHEIGEKLMTSYKSAVQVHPLTKPEQLMNRFSDAQSLLYVTKSLDYCEFNTNVGSFWTSGRIPQKYDNFFITVYTIAFLSMLKKNVTLAPIAKTVVKICVVDEDLNQVQ